MGFNGCVVLSLDSLNNLRVQLAEKGKLIEQRDGRLDGDSDSIGQEQVADRSSVTQRRRDDECADSDGDAFSEEETFLVQPKVSNHDDDLPANVATSGAPAVKPPGTSRARAPFTSGKLDY